MKSRTLAQSEINEISVRFEKNKRAHPNRRVEKEIVKARDLMLKLVLMTLFILGTQSAHAATGSFYLLGYKATVIAASQISAPPTPPATKDEEVDELTFDECETERNLAAAALNAIFPFAVYDYGVCKAHYIYIPYAVEFRDFGLTWPLVIDDIIETIYRVDKKQVERLVEKYNIRGYHEALQQLRHEFDIEGFELEMKGLEWQRESEATGR